MKRRLQEQIATSRYALPVMIAYSAVVWLTAQPLGNDTFIKLAILAVSTLLMALLNNVNALIRIYSRMVSCSFLALATMTAFVDGGASISDYIVQLCCIASILLLFNTYQDKKAQGTVFYAFLFLGLASTQFIQILFFVPLAWILMASKMMAISLRMFFASILGILLPYWFLAGYCVYIGDFSLLVHTVEGIAVFGKPFDFSPASAKSLVTLAYIMTLNLTGIIHFLRNSYGDKIRTRMMYEALIIFNIFTMLFIFLQPAHIQTLTSIMIISSSTLVAHYIALTRTWITNISIYLIIAATLVITACNIWMP